MSIPLNPLTPEDDESPQTPMIISNDSIPADAPQTIQPVALEPEETSLVKSEVLESTFIELDEPGEINQVPAKQPPKPTYIAILTILGLIMLCCVMAGIMILLLRNEIFATGVL